MKLCLKNLDTQRCARASQREQRPPSQRSAAGTSPGRPVPHVGRPAFFSFPGDSSERLDQVYLPAHVSSVEDRCRRRQGKSSDSGRRHHRRPPFFSRWGGSTPDPGLPTALPAEEGR
jgi:hypothetical protein